MAFAPYTNDLVRNELRAGKVPTEKPIILGYFRNKETDFPFEFAERRHPDDNFAPEMPHVIFVAGGTRLAKVYKTVAYVVVDEDENGPVIEKWPTKHYREYPTEWVRE